MVNFSIDQIREIMFQPDRIRNMSVIAHVDHGKSTLTDSLIAKAGIIAMKNAGDSRYMDTRDDEKERGITIKSTGVSLYFELKQLGATGTEEKVGHLFNLIDSPGHVDFSSEVTAALRVTDGALVVVDSVEGVCVQTETVLRQAMQEKIRPVLFVNKVDRNILELQVDGEVMYQTFVKTIENVNIIVGTYESEDMGSLEINPAKGNVAFGSGKDCWAFTLKKFADLYSSKLKVEPEKLMNRFWGDNYFDPKNKLWKTEGTDKDGKALPRAFAQFIMDPIITIARSAMQNDKVKLKSIAEKMDIYLTPEEWEYSYKELNKCIMQRWINAADCILEMMIIHLPSPRAAQKYRYSYLYEGEKDDACAIAIRDCDINGPLMMYISKMIPSSDKGRFFAYGRVFSGKAITGAKVRMIGPNYKPGKKNDVYHGNIQRTVLMMGRKTEFVPDIPCGNTGALVGVDKYLTKTGTVTDSEEAHNIRVMKYSVSPVVRVAIQPKNPAELPKLIEGMRRLSKSDPLVVCINDEQTGQNIIAGSGELHVEICINDLKNEYAQIELITSNPIVAYNETVTIHGEQCMSKSANKHNRLYMSAEPISGDLAVEIEAGRISLTMDKKELSNTLVKDFNFDKNDVAKIWAFGPNDDGPNMIVDVTSGCQFMNEIKDSCVTGFNVVTANGVLCDEPCRAMRFNVHDTNLHPDGIHRGGGQIIPVARRTMYGAELLAAPKLQEPIFLIEITCPNAVSSTVYNIISMKRGEVIEEICQSGAPVTMIKGFLPVASSFGFTEYLRAETSGQAFPNCSFHHWDTMIENPLATVENQVSKIVGEIRKRKGLKPEVPGIDEFRDKL